MGFDRDESSVKFCIKWGVGVVANESAESCVRSSRATAIEPIPEQAGPPDSLPCPREPLIDSAAS